MPSTTSRLASLALGLAVAVTGCAGPADETASEPETTRSSPSESPTSGSPSPATPTRTKSKKPAAPTLSVEVAGDQVTPNAQTFELGVGEPLVVEVRSDRSGELHVHSKPEQYVDFGTGTTRRQLVVETPGTVEVEEHESGAVVAVLEVR
ncbi:hypothetical protein [Nocardioides coralli]|uniref:hypothetical protein n=1 Tax=Nocardioides coralli TaxID=2872154 RepID=UPI001CA39F2C|nr:hypothetical protein [Nocardioides coralli]QZY27927.1 hypothetical protein K6T13_10495 [Nocardioides coralli]